MTPDKKRSPRDRLLVQLLVLGLHHMDRSMGQLMCFACSLAHESGPRTIESCDDDRLVRVIAQYVVEKFPRGNDHISASMKTLTATRGKLCDALRTIGDAHPERGLATIMDVLAARIRMSLHAAKDADLVRAAEQSPLS